jgi:hypothetical protein
MRDFTPGHANNLYVHPESLSILAPQKDTTLSARSSLLTVVEFMDSKWPFSTNNVLSNPQIAMARLIVSHSWDVRLSDLAGLNPHGVFLLVD